MAAKTWFGTNTVLSSLSQEMSETSPGATATSSPQMGWVVGTGSTNAADMDAGTNVASSAFTGTGPPDGSLVTGSGNNGDHFRTTNKYTGSFASANWTWNGVVRGVTQAGAQDGRMDVRLFRGPNADGTSATEINAGKKTGSTVTNLTSSADQNSSVAFNPGAFSVTDEYIFIQVAWVRTGAGGMSTTDVAFRYGDAGTRLVSANFVAEHSSGALALDGGGNVTIAASTRETFAGAIAADGGGVITIVDSTVTPGGPTEHFSGQLELSGGGVVDVAASTRTTFSSLAADGGGSAVIAASTRATFSSLAADGGGSVVVAQSTRSTLGGQLALDGGGTITIVDSTVSGPGPTEHFSGQLVLDGGGSTAIAASTRETFSSVVADGGGSIAIASSSVGHFSSLLASGEALITIAAATRTAFCGALALDGAGSITIVDSTVGGLPTEWFSGALDLTGHGEADIHRSQVASHHPVQGRSKPFRSPQRRAGGWRVNRVRKPR